MAKIDLHDLYRKATASNDAAVDADTLARLAAGEQLGARHEATLAALGASRGAAVALQVALDAVPAPMVEPVARRPRALFAIAASIAAAFVVLVMNGPRVHDARPGLAQQGVEDRITTRDFEDGVATSTSGHADEIFKADDNGA